MDAYVGMKQSEGNRKSVNHNISNVQFTNDDLLEQNKSLAEELAQCQADKDFVWNLWKRLQADKPDMTSVVSMVVAREQEKADKKDKKVLEIIKQRDDQVKLLEEIAADLETQLKQSLERLSGLLIEQTEWQSKLNEMQKMNDKLKEENRYQQEVFLFKSLPTSGQKDTELKARDSQLELKEKEHKEKLKISDDINKDLQEKLSRSEEEAEQLRKDKATSDALLEANKIIHDRVKVLERDLEVTKKEHVEQLSSLEERETQLLKETGAVHDLSEQLEQRDIEISALRKKTTELESAHESYITRLKEQEEIINHLELLQDETQQVLNQQQGDYQAEVASYKRTLNDMREKYLDLQSINDQLQGDIDALKECLQNRQKQTRETQEELQELRRSLKDRIINGDMQSDSETQTVDLGCMKCSQLQKQMGLLQADFDNLQNILHEKLRRISSLEKVVSERMRSQAGYQNNHHTMKENHQSQVSSSVEQELHALQRKLENTAILLSLKDEELQETAKAHSQRLDRYKIMQNNYNLIKQQLKTFEVDSYPYEKEKASQVKRADPRRLQQENSDSVWNELAHYKQEFERLDDQRHLVEEENDQLRVQRANDASTIQELKLLLDDKTQELNGAKDLQESTSHHVSPSKLYSLEKQVEIWKERARNFEGDLDFLRKEVDNLRHKESVYKEEITKLTDEIDDIHANIKEKIDAEVQASEIIADLQKSANKSLDEMVDKIKDLKNPEIQAEVSDYYTKAITKAVEQMVQTSPIAHFKRPSPRKNSISTQTLSENSSTDESDISSSSNTDDSNGPKHDRDQSKKHGKSGKGLSIQDLQTPLETRISRKRRKISGQVHPDLVKHFNKTNFPPKSTAVAREQNSLKLRVLSLQQQVQVLREAKTKLGKLLEKQQQENSDLKGEFSALQLKLDRTKQSVQKLTDELAKCAQERDMLRSEQQESFARKSKINQAEFKDIESRWKLATTECSRLSFQVRTLRGENDMLTAKQKEYQERITRLERVLSQKKRLIDDLRDKIKEIQSTTTREKELLDELKKKNKSLNEREEQRKEQIENLRSRMNEVIEDKHRLQEICQNTQMELETKSRLLQESQELCNHAENAVNEMEKAAYDQLQGQAKQHENAQFIIREKLNKSLITIKEFKILVKSLAEELLKQVHEMRMQIIERRKQKLIEEKRKQNAKASMQQARDLACSILELSSSDLDNFLIEEEQEEIPQLSIFDNDVRERLENEFQKDVRFSRPILKCLMELIDHYWTLRLKDFHELDTDSSTDS